MTKPPPVPKERAINVICAAEYAPGSGRWQYSREINTFVSLAELREKYPVTKTGRKRFWFEVPTLRELETWMFEEGQCGTPDGCTTDPDGKCEHGHKSWLRVLGMI